MKSMFVEKSKIDGWFLADFLSSRFQDSVFAQNHETKTEFWHSGFMANERCDSAAVSFRKLLVSTYLNGIGQSVDSSKHSVATFDAKLDVFTHVTKSTDIVALSRDGLEASLQSCSKHGEKYPFQRKIMRFTAGKQLVRER